jgi:hypothetical protein
MVGSCLRAFAVPKYVESAGDDHLIAEGDADATLDEKPGQFRAIL